jgi:hypothetical protein
VMAQTSLLVFRKACQQLKLRGQRRKNWNPSNVNESAAFLT